MIPSIKLKLHRISMFEFFKDKNLHEWQTIFDLSTKAKKITTEKKHLDLNMY